MSPPDPARHDGTKPVGADGEPRVQQPDRSVTGAHGGACDRAALMEQIGHRMTFEDRRAGSPRRVHQGGIEDAAPQ
jgi:hypothetical protein